MLNLFITTSMLFSQALFAKAFGGTSDDRAYSIVRTTDGGYAVAGYTESFGTGSWDFLVLKLSSSGGLQWARTFGGTSVDAASSIVQTSEGGYAVAGYTRSFGAGGVDLLVLKLSSAGGLQWARTFGGIDDDYAYSIIQTTDGGFAVAGWTLTFGGGSYENFFILRLNSNGGLVWARTYGGDYWEYAYSIIQTTDGGFAVAGRTFSFGAGDEDILVLKISSSGSLSWARTYGRTGLEVSYSLVQTSDGGFAVAGETDGVPLILKLSSGGSLSWAMIYVGAYSGYASSITRTSDGGFAVAGETGRDFFVMKLSSDGSLSWAKTFEGEVTSDDYVYSIVQTTDGGYAVAGETQSFGAGWADFMVLKMASDGNYAGCVQEYSTSFVNMTLSTSTPSVGTTTQPTIGTPSPTTTTPNPAVTDACPPEVEENDVFTGNGITCSPFSGGILFNSPSDLGIKIYSVDGRVAYSGQLQKGENRILLSQGVYLWIAGNYKGKAAVR